MSCNPSVSKPPGKPRKPRTTKKKDIIGQSTEQKCIDTNDNNTDNTALVVEEKIYKKRGRKPKGGKIVPDDNLNKPQKIHISNVIIHLKCKQEDLIQYNNLNNTMSGSFKQQDTEVYPLPYTDNNSTDLFYSEIDTSRNNKSIDTGYYNAYKLDNEHRDSKTTGGIESVERPESVNCIKKMQCYDNNPECICADNQKEINEKLRELSYQLYANNITDKRSSCFWCTCQFDTPTIMIPKFELNKIYNCYGCFCSPECATSFLFSEKITMSVRFERYHLLNYIYCKIYNYTRNINMAPNPYYTLDKYYGNLTIQEYRKLLKTERLLIVIDKPMTRILPELHEYNTSDIMSASGIDGTNGKYKIRKRKHQTKNDILSDNFNFSHSST